MTDLSAARLSVDPNRIVPPSGMTAWLTILVSGAMAFLAVFALMLLFATDRLADGWAEDLAQTSTIRISAPADQLAAQTETALEILSQTPGVARARALTDTEQAALLAPWLGPNLPVAELPVPRLVEVQEGADGFDAEGLRLRLKAEVPGAVLDDHTRWRVPLIGAAERIRTVGWIAVGLIAVSVAAMVTLAANASLSANAGVISVLRLLGAQDNYVARAFTRRFTLRALGGAAGGTLAGLALAVVLPGETTTGFIPGLRFRGVEWAVPLLIPLIVALVAFLATRAAALRRLRETP